MTNATLAEIDPLLAGFESVPSDGIPFITLDKHRRFYLNATLRKLIGIKAHDRVSLAYNPAEHTLAILIGDAASAVSSTNYFVDLRHYMSARRFIAEYRYDIDLAPFKFELQRSGTAAGVFLFKLTDLAAK